jgi:hypothetical protein
LKENKDGSANAEVIFDKKGLEVLVQWGTVALLTKAIDEYAVRPEEVSKPTKRKKVNEPLFTGNLASNKRKSSKVRKTK